MVVVAVVATIFTAGVASAGIGASFSSIMGAGTFAVTGGVAGVAATTSGFLAGSSLAAAMAGGAVGSSVSQGVGMAIGAQDSFSWKGVALSAIGAGVSSGVGAALGPVTSTGFDRALAFAGRGAIASALTQGISVATGLQSSFSWRSVAASAVGAGVGAAVSGPASNLFGNADLGQFATRFTSGMAAGLTAAALKGGKASVTQVATDAFGNALGDSIAAANGQRADPLGEFITQNQPLWETRAAAYDQVVGAFSQPGGSQYAGVQLAAGPGYSGMGAGSDRDQNIDRMLALANRPESGGTWSSMGADGVPHVGFGVFGPDENIRSDDGRGFIDEVRSAAEGSINQGSALGTPLPPSPYRWVSNELVDGDLVRGHWADAPQNARPGDSIRALSDSEAFFAFNPLGRTLGGVGTGLENMAKGVVNLGQQAVLTASDAIGTGMYGLNNALGGRRMDYTLDSALGRSLQTQGFGPTALNTAGGLMRGLASPVTAPFGALYRQDPRACGESLPFVAATFAPMLRGGAVGEAARLYRLGSPVARMERTFDHALSPQLYVEDVAKHYGVNLRGSGQEISVVYDNTLPAGQYGVTRAAEGGRVIRVGPDALTNEATTANTIAHELSHARDYLRDGVHKPHGDAGSMGDGSVYGSGNALENWINGLR
jgi:hypothetical protein